MGRDSQDRNSISIPEIQKCFAMIEIFFVLQMGRDSQTKKISIIAKHF